MAGRRRLDGIQALRGLAALMVVLHHAAAARPGIAAPLAGTDFGLAGVMVFFVISGAVMTHACRDEPLRAFALRRLIRVVPLYWLMTLAFYLIVTRREFWAGEAPGRLRELVLSLLFVPHLHPGVPGRVWPLLVPGWTLNYEMFFFALFGLGIALRRPAGATLAALAALVAAGLLLAPTGAVARTWTSPLLLLFGGGILIARHAARRGPTVPAPALGAAAAALLGLGALRVLPEAATLAALAGGSLLAVAAAMEARARPQGPLARIGEASYSLYLSHTIVMIPLMPALRRLPLEGWPQAAAVLALTLATCTAAGLALHAGVERPMLRALRRLADRGPARPAPGPAARAA